MKTTVSDQLFQLVKNKYGTKKNFDYFYEDFKKSFDFCTKNPNITYIPIALFENKKLIAHSALIIDKRQKEGEAFFGFFESPNDKKVCNELWSQLKYEANKRDISVLKGPINGSIWHQYRCIKETNRSSFFKSEPISETYYYKLLKQFDPSAEVTYYSAYRHNFTKVLGLINKNTDLLINNGFKIISNPTITTKLLQEIAFISQKVFSVNSWGYTELTMEEFLKLYSPTKLSAHLSKLYVLLKNDQLIGYCGTGSDDNNKTLIIKTICIVSSYQGLGLGNALALEIHKDAIKEGFRKVIYALIREGNQIKNFPKDDAVIFRKYAAFEYTI